MKKIFILVIALLGLSFGASAQYCTPSWSSGCIFGPNHQISAVSVNTLNWTIGAASCNVKDYTSLSTTLTKGLTYSMSVTTENWMGCGIWIDYNGDFTFDNITELLYHEYSGAGSNIVHTFSFTVPSTAVTGCTRLRVVGGWGSDPTNPCVNTDQYGDYKDFTVCIIDGLIANFTNTIACAGQPVTFTDASTCTAGTTITNWSWNFGDGSPVVNATTGASQTHTFINSGSNPIIDSVKLTITRVCL